MKLFLTLLTVSALSSCMTAEKATGYLEKKGLLDDVCAKAFPVTDSVGAPVIDSTNLANNPDFTATIDSLSRQVEELNESFATTVDSATSQVAAAYQTQLLKVQRQLAEVKDSVASLKAKYKPCQPDTVYKTVPHYTRDRAYEQTLLDQIVALEKTIGQKEVQIGVLQSQLQEMTQKKNWWRMWGGFVTWGAIALVILGFVFRSRLPF